MPFTPFHFGPGLILKAGAPRRFSFLAYATTQVAIDLESWYFLTRDDWPVHRDLHTFVLGAAVGVGVGVLTWTLASIVHRARKRLRRMLPSEDALPLVQSEVALSGAVAGGILGGLTHSLLDGIMHADIKPLRPFSDANPLLGAVDLSVLHIGCVVLGVLGVLLLISNRGVWTQRSAR